MGFIPQVTCRRCQRKYSALRGRCPHCGTRKTEESTRTQPTTGQVRQTPGGGNSNAKWQLIFGAILLAAVLIAVIALVSMSLNAADPEPTPSATPSAALSTPSPTPVPTPTPTPTPTVDSISVYFLNSELTTGFTHRVTDPPLQLTATVYPASEQAVVSWRSGDEDVVTVSETGLVTAVGSGKTFIVAECGAVAKELEVIVP